MLVYPLSPALTRHVFSLHSWMVPSLDYDDEIAFQAKPLASVLLNTEKDPMDIVNAKRSWFKDPEEFKKSIIWYFEPDYWYDTDFLICLARLRKILYSTEGYNEVENLINLRNNDKAKEKEDPDPMKEDLFRKCMEAIDDYLKDGEKGRKEIEQINSLASASHSQTSEIVGEGEDGSG